MGKEINTCPQKVNTYVHEESECFEYNMNFQVNYHDSPGEHRIYILFDQRDTWANEKARETIPPEHYLISHVRMEKMIFLNDLPRQFFRPCNIY